MKRFCHLLTIASFVICSLQSPLAKPSSLGGRYIMVSSNSPIVLSHWRGHLGEQLIEQHYLNSHLKLSHQWIPLTPTKGRPGIDLLYVKYDRHGYPQQVWVGEVKFGNARLGFTKKTGIQASHQWYRFHFKQLAQDYRLLSQTNIVKKHTSSTWHTLPVKSGTFWTENRKGAWQYSGPSHTFKTALKEAQTLSQFYQKCAQGQCVIHSRLYEVTHQQDHLRLRVRVAHGLNYGISQRNLTTIDVKEINKDHLGRSTKLRKALFTTLRKSHPNLTVEQANRIYDREISAYSGTTRTENVPVSHTLFMALSDLVLNAYSLSSVAERKMGQAVGSLAAGLSIEIAMNYLMTHVLNYTQVSLFGELLGGAMGSVLYASLDWLNHGQVDPISLAQGMAYTLGSALSSYGAFTLAASYGIAGSGASIGSLSGAAATKATLAWYGGGTLASGGGGMMVGSMVLSGVTIGMGALMAFGTKMAVNAWEANDRSTFQTAVLNHVIHGVRAIQPETSIAQKVH